MSEAIVSFDVDMLFERMTDARFALIGEASHGTHEFYRERAEITKRLIADHGYTFVAAEADWPKVIHIDETRALEPLELTSEWEAGELPETYPWAV